MAIKLHDAVSLVAPVITAHISLLPIVQLLSPQLEPAHRDSYLHHQPTTHGGFSLFHALHGLGIFTSSAHDGGLSYRAWIEWVVCYLVTPVWLWEGHFREGVYFQCSRAVCQCRPGQYSQLSRVCPSNMGMSVWDVFTATCNINIHHITHIYTGNKYQT